MANQEPLAVRLTGRYERRATTLPKALREEVAQAFFPLTWDQLAPTQREQLAMQLDAMHDPDQAEIRQRWWNHFVRVGEVKRQITVWENVATPTAQDLIRQQTELDELREELARLEVIGGPRPQPSQERQPLPVEVRERYIAYPGAFLQLQQRLAATPEEMAAWVFLGPDLGGLSAYLHANELKQHPRFHYEEMDAGLPGADLDYLMPLQACWFVLSEVQSFAPKTRYITGRDLIERWSKVPGLSAAAYIDAKVRESRLVDLHPLSGGTRAGRDGSGKDALPPVEAGLFSVAEVEAIEAEDFGMSLKPEPETEQESPDQRRNRLKARVEQERNRHTKNFLEVVAAEERISVSRLKQLTQAPKPKKPVQDLWLAPVQRIGGTASKRRK